LADWAFVAIPLQLDVVVEAGIMVNVLAEQFYELLAHIEFFQTERALLLIEFDVVFVENNVL
jgi:hypothetical protein